ncbi:hypothetical protein BD779DRAFT_1542585 [Infundibulicybe gibba]|nr:hypothetical protein BD779DRAFT_1542585 [Infundibulicybe gibba]
MVDLVDPPWLSTPRDPHSCHMGLETLTIRWSLADPSIDTFFSSITLPSLQTLEIDFDSAYVDDTIDDPPDLTPGTVSGFFERSCKHLSTLCLTNITFFPEELIICLSFTPSLVSLDAHFGFESGWFEINLDGLLRALDVNLPGYILPRLHSLSFRGLPTFSEELLDADLTLECSIPPDQSTDRIPQFHRFMSEGLNITYGEDWGVYNSIQASSSELGEET